MANLDNSIKQGDTDLSYEDLLFLDFRDKNNVNSLKELLRLLNPWLHAIVISLVFEEKITENILDLTVEEFIKRKHEFNPKERSISYELFLIAKKIIDKDSK